MLVTAQPPLRAGDGAQDGGAVPGHGGDEQLLSASVRDRHRLPEDRTLDVLFHEFMADDLAMVERIYALAGPPVTPQARALVDKHRARGDTLIIIGDEVSRHPDLRRTVIKSGVQNDVRFLGFVPIDTLRTFYDVAKVFVFPSLYEGFGLPPLEAMAHGTPVVTSNTSSLPEVVGNAAVLVNPENVFEIMRAIHRVLVDQALRDKLKQKGYEQVKHFSWEDSVQRILNVYREIAGDGPAATA